MASHRPICASFSRTYLCAASILLASLVLAVPPFVAAQTYTFSSLYSFQGANGEYPLGGLVVDSKGNLYGTTSEGGAHGSGTVFKMTAAGKETVLHSFKGGTTDGLFPEAGLVRDSAGNLYGTTTLGGADGYGIVFKVTASGEESVLHSFGQTSDDGRYPSANLTLDSKGDLYGTTQQGGTSGFGTIFKVDGNGKETIVHNFAGNPSDGQYPVQNMIRDAKGNFYGATELGGVVNDGIVFKLDASGNETVLFSFVGGSGGNYPFGGVVLDAIGNLYGGTAYGGNGVGLIFELDTSVNETVLYTFGGSGGSYPSSNLIRDSHGNLFGTTEFGGSGGAGVAFEVSSGVETVLHNFGGTDGADLLTPLVSDAAGNLYGTTTQGGTNGQGTVFKLSR